MTREDPEQRMLRRLFARLRKDPTVVRSGTTYVDVPGTIDRQVACGDGLCSRGLRGRALLGKTCCTTFDVPVDAKDVRRIEKILPEVRAIRDVGAAIDRAGGFWLREDGERRLRTRPSGACVFFSAPPGEAPRCTIHEWAALRGLEHREWKPETCCLFPLYLVQWSEDAFVTGYGSPWFCEIEPCAPDEVKSFACLHPPAGRQGAAAGRPLLVEQEGELRYRLGTRRWSAMLRKLRALGHPV